jgi:hypothetical protein
VGEMPQPPSKPSTVKNKRNEKKGLDIL